MNRKLVILILLAATLVASTALAIVLSNSYLEEFRGLSNEASVKKVWLDICEINKVKYPVLDLVQPGDTILMPGGYFYVAQKATGEDHMWSASVFYNENYVQPYLHPVSQSDSQITPTDSSKVVEQTAPDAVEGWLKKYWYWIVIIVLAAVLFSVLGQNRAQTELVSDSFVAQPPHFTNDPDASVRQTAESALHRVYGRHISIIGDIERGYINGEQTVFFNDGTTRVEHFQNEQGYRATVEFPDKTRCQVVSLWRCFNPCYSAVSAQFAGTFRPENAQTAQEIPAISDEQVGAISRNIQGSEQPLEAKDVPGVVEPDNSGKTTSEITPVVDAPGAPEAPAAVDPIDDRIMKVAEVQLSPGRVTIKGFEGNVDQFTKVFNLVKGDVQPPASDKASDPASTAPVAQVEKSAGPETPAS